MSLCCGKKIKVFVKTLSQGTRIFPLRKNGTERIKEKKFNVASLWFQLAQLDCRAIFWLQIRISYLLKVCVCVCVYIYLAMHFEVFQFPAFSHFRKITQKRNCGFCFVLNPNSPVTRQDFKQSLHYTLRSTYHCMRN